MRIFDVLEPLDTDDVVKCVALVGQYSGKIALFDLDTLELKDLRIEVAAPHVETDPRQPFGKGPFAGRDIEDRAARAILHDLEDRFVDRFVSKGFDHFYWIGGTFACDSLGCHAILAYRSARRCRFSLISVTVIRF